METKPRIEIDLKQVESLASRGMTKAQIADALGISERTLYTQQAENAEFAEAIKRGKAKGIATISNALFENAKKGNTAAQIFFLKAQAGWREKDALDVQVGGAVQVQFIDDLDPDED